MDVAKAITGWAALKVPAQAATNPAGANASAILQPLYLADPEYVWGNGDTNSSTMGAHWGVALVPGIAASDQNWIRMVVGYSHPNAQFQGTPMTGLPSAQIEYVPGGLFKPDVPFRAETNSEAISKLQNAPPADYRAQAGPLWDTDGTSGKWAAKRLAVVPRITIEDGGNKWMTNLVVGFSSIRPNLKDPLTGAAGPPLGNSLVIAEKYGTQQAFHLATWPVEPPFGAGVLYDIPYAVPSVDETTGLVGVPVTNKNDNTITWFVLDLSQPKSPRTVAKIKNQSQAAAMANGVLFAVDKAGMARAYRVAKGGEVVECANVQDDGPFRVRLSANEVLPTQNTDTQAWHEAPPHPVGYNQITVTINGKPNTSYTLERNAVAGAGGHDHWTRSAGQAQASPRPLGGFMPGETVTVQVATDATGNATAIYQSPIVGGDVTLTITEEGGAQVRRTIHVQVPGLVELPVGAHYQTGTPSQNHPNKYYGRPELIEVMQSIANRFWDQYQDLDPTIQFNDMSLICGGNFRTDDAGAHCEAQGRAPSPRHGEHKYGLNVDGDRHLRLMVRSSANARPVMMPVTLSSGGTQVIPYYTTEGQRVTVTTGELWTALNRLYVPPGSSSVWESRNHWHVRVNWR